MRTLVGADDILVLWAVIIAGTGAAIWLEQTYRWAARIGAPLLALGMAMLLSNTRIMPMSSPTYDLNGAYLVPLALALLLFRANLFHIVRVSGRMFLVFHISALGTVVGAVIAAFALRGHVPQIERAIGMMTGSYIGGGINFFAVKESLHVAENIANPLLVADNFVMAGIFMVLLVIASSRFFLRHYSHPHSRPMDAETAKNLAAEHWRRKGIGLVDLASSLGFAFIAVAAADLLGRAVNACFADSPGLGSLQNLAHTWLTNQYVLITAVSLSMATLFHRRLEPIHGSEEIGGYMLYVFLFAIGLPANLASVIWNVPLLFVLCAIIAATNLAVTLFLGKLFRLELEQLLLCVNATLGGPPTAAAMANSCGWDALVLPSILVGIWGYVIGTSTGILLAEILLRL